MSQADNDKVAQLKLLVGRLETKATTLTSQFNQLQTQVLSSDALSKQVVGFLTTISNLEAFERDEVARMVIKCASLTTTGNALKPQIASLDTSINNVSVSMNDLTGSITNTQTNLTGSQQQLPTLTKWLAQFKTSTDASLLSLNNYVNTNVTAMNASIAGLSSSMSGALAAQSASLAGLTTTVADNVSALNARVNQLSATIPVKTSEIGATIQTSRQRLTTLDTVHNNTLSSLNSQLAGVISSDNALLATLQTRMQMDASKMAHSTATLESTVTSLYNQYNNSIGALASTFTGGVASIDLTTLSTSLQTYQPLASNSMSEVSTLASGLLQQNNKVALLQADVTSTSAGWVTSLDAVGSRLTTFAQDTVSDINSLQSSVQSQISNLDELVVQSQELQNVARLETTTMLTSLDSRLSNHLAAMSSSNSTLGLTIADSMASLTSALADAAAKENLDYANAISTLYTLQSNATATTASLSTGVSEAQTLFNVMDTNVIALKSIIEGTAVTIDAMTTKGANKLILTNMSLGMLRDSIAASETSASASVGALTTQLVGNLTSGTTAVATLRSDLTTSITKFNQDSSTLSSSVAMDQAQYLSSLGNIATALGSNEQFVQTGVTDVYASLGATTSALTSALTEANSSLLTQQAAYSGSVSTLSTNFATAIYNINTQVQEVTTVDTAYNVAMSGSLSQFSDAFVRHQSSNVDVVSVLDGAISDLSDLGISMVNDLSNAMTLQFATISATMSTLSGAVTSAHIAQTSAMASTEQSIAQQTTTLQSQYNTAVQTLTQGTADISSDIQLVTQFVATSKVNLDTLIDRLEVEYGTMSMTLTTVLPTLSAQVAEYDPIPIPISTSVSENFTVLPGSTVTLAAQASGPLYPPTTIKWQILTTVAGAIWTNLVEGQGTTSVPSNVTGTPLTLTNITSTQHGYQYRAVFTNAFGALIGEPWTTGVIDVPTLASYNPDYLQPLYPTEGDSVTLEVVANGSGPIMYEWQSRPRTTDGTGVVVNMSIPPVATNNFMATRSMFNQEYRVTVTNSYGSVSTQWWWLLVKYADTPTINPSESSGMYSGNSKTLTSSQVRSPMYNSPTIQWSKSVDGGSTWNTIVGAESDTLLVTMGSTTEDGHQYRVEYSHLGTNGLSPSKTSSVVTTNILVNAAPTITQHPTPTTQYIAENGSGTLMSKVSNWAVDNLGDTMNWQRSRNGGTTYTFLGNGDISTIYVPVVAAGFTLTRAYPTELYRVEYSNNYGTVVSSNATVNVAWFDDPKLLEPEYINIPRTTSRDISCLTPSSNPIAALEWKMCNDAATWVTIPTTNTSTPFSTTTTSNTMTVNCNATGQWFFRPFWSNTQVNASGMPIYSPSTKSPLSYHTIFYTN